LLQPNIDSLSALLYGAAKSLRNPNEVLNPANLQVAADILETNYWD
jgi:hypothetical protein